MCTQLFDPKVDYVFKNIFGSEITKEYIEDSFWD